MTRAAGSSAIVAWLASPSPTASCYPSAPSGPGTIRPQQTRRRTNVRSAGSSVVGSAAAAAVASASNASSAAASTAGEQTGPPAREVEHILDKRMAVGGGMSYLVQWQGQARTDAEYIPEHQLDDVVDAVVAFNATMSA